MVDIIQNNLDFFPLSFDFLKVYAHRWVSEIPETRVKRVTLYRYSSYYAKFLHKQHPVKYCIVFDVEDEVLPEHDPETPHVRKDNDRSIYSYIEYFHTIRDQDSYLSLMDAGFSDVYKHKPDENFKDEWIFLTRLLAKDDKGVKINEPCWVLYNSENTEYEAANCSIPMTSPKPSMTPKKIGYSDFVQIFKIGSEELDNWNNFETRSNGVYVKIPESYKDCFLTPGELAALTAHPTGNLSEPALAFPCSKKELIRFIDFYGLAGFLNTEALKMVADGPEAVETEQETVTQFAVSLPPVHQTVNFFTKGNGGIWHIGYEGKTEIFRHLVGFLYLAYLLERPGQDVPCTEIYQTEKPANSITSHTAIAEGLNLGSTSRIIVHGVDQEEPPTRESLKKHLDQLWADYYDAESDLERKEILAEVTLVKQSLNAERTQHDLHSAKVQTYIKKGIDRAISALDKAGMNTLAEHLKLHINPNGKYGYIYTGTAWEITL